MTTMRVLRSLDFALLLVALPVFVAAGFPILGWVVTATAWSLQRGVQAYANRRAREADDPRTTVGVLAGSMIGRGWFMALAIFAVGLSDNHAGLAAAVLTIAVFTVYFTIGMILRPFDVSPSPPRPGVPTGGAR